MYIPDRNDIISIDFEPVKGKEIGKYRPALVLSSKAYNEATKLIICCPISTSIRGGALEVPINNLDKKSVVASSIVQTLSWKTRGVKFITHAEPNVMQKVHERLLPMLGAQEYIESQINND